MKENINLDISDKRKIFYIVKITSHQAQILEKKEFQSCIYSADMNKVFLNLQTFHLHNCYILVNQVIYVSYYHKQF